MKRRIVIDPPVNEGRRDRVERQLFAQLAAVRITDRADAAIPAPRKNRLAIGFAFAGFAVAVAGVLFLITRDGVDRGGTETSPSRVVTPIGGSSQFTVPGALIEAKSDTWVEWQQGGDGSITITLHRGAVDCQVEPRKGKPPFRVVAGDVRVTVVGTRFMVTKTPAPRVDVSHGIVKVEAPGGTWLVEAGEAWPAVQTAAAEPEPTQDQAVAEPEIEMDAMRVHRKAEPKQPVATTPDDTPPPSRTPSLAQQAYNAAQGYEESDPKLAAANYRALANGKDSAWAAVALVGLADVQIHHLKDPQAALATLAEHAQRFPQSPTRQDAAWLRILALKAMGKRDEARGAAADYLRQFPQGSYARDAARLTK